jgi:hypothetical protein
VREVFEKTGYAVEVARLAAVDWKRSIADAVFVFECRITGGVPTPSDETSDIEFIDPVTPPDASAHVIARVQAVIASPDRVLLQSTS